MTSVVGSGGKEDINALPLFTKKRRFIRNEQRAEKPPAALAEGARIIAATFAVTRVLSVSATYNCFGLAFASRRTWIYDEAEVRKILEDDGYQPLPWDASIWDIGDVVLYRTDDGEISHVAVVVERRADLLSGDTVIQVISAWGESGEYLHPVAVVSPLLGRPFQVMSQRRLYAP